MEEFLETFFSWTNIKDNAPSVIEGFKTNLSLMFVAEAAVLVWGLVLALFRGTRAGSPPPCAGSRSPTSTCPGRPGDRADLHDRLRPPHLRGALLQRPVAVHAGRAGLTVLYGAYVAEVYRAGIESIHWSQTAAARSLGLSQGKTMRFVVLPQAVRRVIPPLMNDFIGLQKDTALIGVIGVLDGFRRAQIYAGQNFNLSSFTVLALCYVVITFPMTRFTDRMLRRDQERLRVGGR